MDLTYVFLRPFQRLPYAHRPVFTHSIYGPAICTLAIAATSRYFEIAEDEAGEVVDALWRVLRFVYGRLIG